MPYDPVRDSAGREGYEDGTRGRSDPTPTPPAASLAGYQLSQTASGLPLPPAFHEDQAWKRTHQSVTPHLAGSVSFSRPTSSSSSMHGGWAPAPAGSFHNEDRTRRESSTLEGSGFVQPLPPGMHPSSWEEERRRSSNGSIGHGVPLPGSNPRMTMLPPSMPPHHPHPQPHGVSAAMYRSTSGESEHSAHGGSGRPSSGHGRAGSAHSYSQPLGTVHGLPYGVMSSASPPMTRPSPAYSARGSLPPSSHIIPSPAHTPVGSHNSYFPSHYPPPYASSGTHASPRNSISNLLTPVELTSTPARVSPLPYPGVLQPFAFTPGGSSAPRYTSGTPGHDNGAPSLAAFDRDSSSSRPGSSQRQSLPAATMQSPHQAPYSRPSSANVSDVYPAGRSSIQGWTTGSELGVARREYEPVTRKITLTGGSLAAMMNPTSVVPEKTAEGMKTPGSTSAWDGTHAPRTADTPMTRTPPSSVRKASHNDLDDACLSPTQVRSNEDSNLKRQASEQEMSAAEALSALAGTPSASRSADYQQDVQQSSQENSSSVDAHRGEREGNAVNALKQEDMISPKTTPAAEEPPKKRKRATKAVTAEGVTESDKPEKPKQSAAGRKRKASAQNPVAGTAGDDATASPSTSKAAANGKSRKRAIKDTQNDTKPSESTQPEPTPTAYLPNRISDANTVLRPITQDELAYIRNPRNIKNPLKTGRPTKFGEAKPQPSPYGGEPNPSGSNTHRGLHPDRLAMVATTDSFRGVKDLRAGDGPQHEVRQLGRGSSSNNQALGERSISGAKRARSEVENAPGGVDARISESTSQAAKRPRVEGDRGKGLEVAEHYNKRGNQGVDRRKDSRIIGLRSCNNWIKAVMIQTYVRRRPERQWSGREPNGRVLDMGCGKGGDIAKWDNANIEEYVGIDVAEGSIEDFKTRLREMKRRLRYKADLYVLDCFRTSILELPRDKLKPGFDNVSMQFCIHYAFEKVQSVRQMLENVAMFLREGGIYFGTTVSKDKIVAALNEIPPEAEELVISNDLFRMEFTEREHDGPFGHAYNFSLKDAIDDCEEYVVDWGEFTSIAAEYKLKCIYRKDFDEMFAEHTQNPEFFHMAKRMNVIDEEGDLYMDQGQWAAVSMYLGFAFEKMPMSWNLTREIAAMKEEAAISEDVLPPE
ncbi:hypothetical protein QFC21_004338 [Naganishia friedmannii]|uniref:Uncharacterized protein n=1 Tax=Naganishia friedmannii TaxID=89922 RepID=A0ACC2VHX8_9TREE|nr:hypothetical protein QFC21_004338 [Naganishia friedmannii]